ncbi:quinone oxidoreductase [Bacillus sp. BGMRC 2118]|nr:quinone oxidoreductase [Bacillus sp. BGMRC 2118]
MKALVFETFGGPEVLHYKDVVNPNLKPDEVLVQSKAIGLNFADIYRRKGNYHITGKPPYILGYEGAGVVVEVGESVTTIKKGDRIAYADAPFANAELVAVPEEKAIPLPESISFEVAASILLQGLTAHYLIHDSYKIKEGDTAVIHACAGGVGQLLIQMIKILGGKAIGLTSSLSKAKVAEKKGADYVFLYGDEWVNRTLEITNGQGVEVVFESVGSTLLQSFSATKVGGTVVFFGMAGGNPEPVDPRMLMDTSKTLTGGDLWNVLTSRQDRINRSQQLFNWIEKQEVLLSEPIIFPLKDGRKAHELLQSRKSSGKILLVP